MQACNMTPIKGEQRIWRYGARKRRSKVRKAEASIIKVTIANLLQTKGESKQTRKRPARKRRSNEGRE